MGRFVIVAYRPKVGKRGQLLQLVKKHYDVLSAQGLVTDRPAYVMKATDGTLLEVFEWRSEEAVRQAHTNPAVQTMWAEFDEVCEYVPLSRLAESYELFAEFDTLSL